MINGPLGIGMSSLSVWLLTCCQLTRELLTLEGVVQQAKDDPAYSSVAGKYVEESETSSDVPPTPRLTACRSVLPVAFARELRFGCSTLVVEERRLPFNTVDDRLDCFW